MLLYEKSIHYNLKNASQEKNMFNVLIEISNKLSTSFDLNDIFEIVYEDFPKLCILGCYISFFESIFN